MANPLEWVAWREESWFYRDATPDKRGAAMAVRVDWDMQPVLERGEQLCALSRARSPALIAGH